MIRTTTQAPPLLSVESLAVDFVVHGVQVPAVRDLSFAVYPGQTVALVGESGSGKTVTSQAILGILPRNGHISGGRILFSPAGEEPRDIAALDPDSKAMRDLRGDRISLIFQEPMVSLSPMHTIGNQIQEAMRLHRGVSRGEASQASREMLALVGFPDPERALSQYPFELSGGLRQRAMIAMALICRPSLLIADEPTTALDVTVQAQILQLMKSLQESLGMAILLITHDLGVVANLAEEVVVMYQGEVMERGPANELLPAPRHPYLQGLLQAVPHFNMTAGERLRPLREVHPLTEDFHRQRQPWTPQERDAGPHLRIRGLCKSFADRQQHWFRRGKTRQTQAVQNLDLDIAVGECFGLVGESGCGKTTLGKLLMRALTPDSGQILYNDRGQIIDWLALPPKSLRDFRQRLGLVFQDPYSALNPRMTILRTLCEPLHIHRRGSRRERHQRAQELMALVGLDGRYLNRYPHSFSGGQRQRISIARALALDPELLILDEPVSALDVSVQAQILNLLKDLQRQLNLTFVFISHNLAVVDYIADRIGVMCRGALVEVGHREQLFRRPTHPYTQALLAAVPYPDLKRPLDFARVSDERYRNPAAWPAPYTYHPGDATCWEQIEPGHQVRVAQRSTPARRTA